MAGLGPARSPGQSNAARYDAGRNRRLFRPALHSPTPPSLSRQEHTGIRDDTPFGKPTQGLLRRLRLLHHLGAPGQIHSLAVEGVDTPRSASGKPHARFQRLYKRPRRPFGQYVRHGRARQGGVPPLPASVVPPPEALSEPQHRPPSATRHIPRRRRPARHQEVVYRKRCALRPVDAPHGPRGRGPRQPPI